MFVHSMHLLIFPSKECIYLSYVVAENSRIINPKLLATKLRSLDFFYNESLK